MTQKYKFSMDFWNSDHEKNFNYIKNYFDPTLDDGPYDFLEVGVFEGRTSLWLLDNVLSSSRKDRLTLIDPDVGPNWSSNVKLCDNFWMARLIKEYSFEALPRLYLEGNRFDLAYLDGDHNAPGLLEDAVMTWRLLKVNGIMLFDDYLMRISDPWFYISHQEFGKYKGLTWQHPRSAIDSFLNIYKGQYEVVIDNYQIGIKKLCELGPKNLNHGDSSQKAIYTV
jgi:hypothetical protein